MGHRGRASWSRLLGAACPIALLALLQGCIGVDTTIRFSADGSGTASIAYRVSQFVTRLGTGEGETGRVPLPISDADFRQAVAEVRGVQLAGDVRRTENEDDIRIEASMRFDRIESLTSVRGLDTMPATLTRVGDGWRFRLVIAQASDGAGVDTQTRDMVRALFSDYALTFVIEAPVNVKSASLGVVDGRSVTYRIAIPDLLDLTSETVLEVAW